MMTHTLETDIDVDARTGTVLVRNSRIGPSPAQCAISFERLQTLYQEVGEHERHYSTVRMAATSLLFTLAILSTGFFWDRMFTVDARFLQFAACATVPLLILSISVAVNVFYGRISARARTLEFHLENLLALTLAGTPHVVKHPNMLLLRAFERHQNAARGAAGKPATSGAEAFVERFERAITANQKLPHSWRDGPFWLVLLAVVVYLAVISIWYFRLALAGLAS